jgi:Cdc6-related protein, AAA superfamily ATPase
LRLAGIEDVVDDQAKEYIVSQAGLRGDMGYAMGLLAGSLTLSSQLKDARIRLEHVTQVDASYLDVSMALAVRWLDIHEKLLLYSICTLLSVKEQTRVSMGEAESAYSDLCLHLNFKPRMHTQLWCYVQKLYDLGIIDTWVGGRGQRGRTTNISVPHRLNPLISELRRQIKNMPKAI